MLRTERHARLLFDRIRQVVPDAQIEASDYGFSFGAFSNKTRRAIWLRRVARPDIGQQAYRLAKRDLPEAIQLLTATP